MGIAIPSTTQSIIDVLSRHGLEVDSVSGARLSTAEPAARRYVAVAVPDIKTVHRLLEALAGLDWRSVMLCRAVQFVTDSARPGVRLAVLVGVTAPDARILH